MPEFGIKFNRVNKNLIKWEYIGKGAAPKELLNGRFLPSLFGIRESLKECNAICRLGV